MADLGLALRLIRGAGKREFFRLVVTALGVGLATLAVLVGVTAPRVSAQALEVEAARTPVVSEVPVGKSPGLQVDSSTVLLADQSWTRITVSQSGPNSPLPPGLNHWPPVGTTIVSPALAELLHNDGSLAQSIGPVTKEVIEPAGLTAPDELFSYTVSDSPTQSGTRTPDEETAEFLEVSRFGGTSIAQQGSGLFLVLEIAVLVVTPAVLFLVTVLRLSAVSRTRRTRALTLVGMSPSRTARLYSQEMAVIAVIGYVIGVAGFTAIQGFLGESGLLGIRWWPEHGRLGAFTFVVTGVLAIALVKTVARRSMLATSVRRTRGRDSKPPSWTVWLAAILGFPAAGFLIATTVIGLMRPSDQLISDRHTIMILVAILAATVAVVLGIPHLVGGIAERWATRASISAALGLRGAAHRLPSSQRLIAFVACAVMVAGISTAFVALSKRSAVGDPDDATIAFELADIAADPDWSRKLPEGPVTIETDLAGNTGTYAVLIADCSGVTRQAAAMFPQSGECTESVQRGAGTQNGDGSVTSLSLGEKSIPIPAGAPHTSGVTWDFKFPISGTDWLTHLDSAQVTYWVSRDDEDYQAILGGLVARFPDIQIEAGVDNLDQYAEYRKQIGIVRAAVALGILLSVCSFVVTAIENRWERSRSVSMLVAMGTSRRHLRTANLVEFTFPVAVAAIPAATVGILGGWAVVSVDGSDGMFATSVLLTTAIGAVACVLLAAVVGWVTGNATFRREAVADS